MAERHTCIRDDGGTPNRRCYACEAEKDAEVVAQAHDAMANATLWSDPVTVPATASAMRCSIHKSYRSARPPKQNCITCWAIYGRRRALEDGLRSRGKARGGGQSSKAKGREAVKLVRELLLRWAHWLDAGDIFVKAGAQGGVDIHLSPKAKYWLPFGIEVKSQEALNIWAALKQAADNAKAADEFPVVFFKRAHSPLYVAARAEDFLTWLKSPAPAPALPPPGPSTETPPALTPSTSS